MGSAIGDYIHLHAKNYDAFGINEPEGTGGQGGIEEGKKILTQYITERKNAFREEAERFSFGPDDEQFLQTLKLIMCNWSQGDAVTSCEEGVLKGVQATKKMLEDRFGKGFAEEVIQMTNEMFAAEYHPEKATAAQQVQAKGVNKIEINETTGHYASTILKPLLQLEAAIAEGVKGNKRERTKLLNQVKKFKTTLLSFNNKYAKDDASKYDLLSSFQEALKSDDGSIVKTKTGAQLNPKHKRVQKFYKEINEFIGYLHATKGVVATYGGTALEYAAAAAACVAYVKSMTALDDLVKNGINSETFKYDKKKKTGMGLGSVNTSLEFNTDQFSKYVDLKKLYGKNVDIGQGNWTFSVGSSQDKVDLVGSPDEINPRWLSIKNYNLHPGAEIHVVSEAPLLNILLGIIKDGVFINHFLNIKASHEDDNDGKISGAISSAREQAELVMKITILEASLAGYKQNRANTFLVNDTSAGGKLRLVSMASLISTIAEHLDYLNISMNGEKQKGEVILNNRNVNGAKQRITDLLQQLYNYKIAAAIKGNVFKDEGLDIKIKEVSKT